MLTSTNKNLNQSWFVIKPKYMQWYLIFLQSTVFVQWSSLDSIIWTMLIKQNYQWNVQGSITNQYYIHPTKHVDIFKGRRSVLEGSFVRMHEGTGKRDDPILRPTDSIFDVLSARAWVHCDKSDEMFFITIITYSFSFHSLIINIPHLNGEHGARSSHFAGCSQCYVA